MKKNEPITGKKVCAVVLEELKKQEIDISQEDFLKEWNERIETGGCGYNKVDTVNLKEEISEMAVDRLSWYLEPLLLPLESYLKIYEKLGRKIDPVMVDFVLRENLKIRAKNVLKNERKDDDLIDRALNILIGANWDENSENFDYLIKILENPETPLLSKELVADKFNGDINKLPLRVKFFIALEERQFSPEIIPDNWIAAEYPFLAEVMASDETDEVGARENIRLAIAKKMAPWDPNDPANKKLIEALKYDMNNEKLQEEVAKKMEIKKQKEE